MPVPAQTAATVVALLVAVAAFAATASVPDAHAAAERRYEPRIVNGTAAGPLPWQVAIVPRDANPIIEPFRPFCGGTIRDATHVVTAAHCVPTDPGDDPGEIAVLAGMNSLSDPPAPVTQTTLHRVSRITTHPAFRDTASGYDVAVLTLENGIALSADGPRRSLPVIEAGAGPQVGASAVISGWGRTADETSPDALHSARVFVQTDDDCRNYGAEYLPALMLCAGAPFSAAARIDACQGDSGGPLARQSVPSATPPFVVDRLIGIVSFGVGCGLPDFPGVYTRLSEPSTNALATDLDPTPRVGRAGPPVISGTAAGLSCTPSAWKDVPERIKPDTVVRSWLRVRLTADGQQIESIETIAGQSSPTYVPTTADNGTMVACQDRATNAGGSLTQSSGLLAIDGVQPPASPVAKPPPAGGVTLSPLAPPTGDAAKFPAKLEVLRAGVKDGKLDVLAEITRRATGTVSVRYRAAGRTTRFSARIDSDEGRIRISRTLPRAQARLGTGIMEISYAGNARVSRDDLRLRAASGKALLRREVAELRAGRLRVSGTISERARGIVRIRLDYVDVAGALQRLPLRATIEDGTWRLDTRVPTGAALRGGQLSIQFTGYLPRRIRGEQGAKRVLPL